MALTSAIRRASSRGVPLALRASAGSQKYFHHHRGSVFVAGVRSLWRNTLQKSLFPSFLNHYFSKTRSDTSLVRIIDTKIQYAVDSQKRLEVPEGFPFEIEDHPGQQTVTLRREYQGETITVEVHLPCYVVGGEDNGDHDKEKDKGNQIRLQMVVRVSKNEGPCLEFGLTAYPNDIEIDSLSIKDTESSEEQLACEGIFWSKYLDDDLQKAFSKYLEIRGIGESTTDFLCGFMVDKDWRKSIVWLKKLQKVFQA